MGEYADYTNGDGCFGFGDEDELDCYLHPGYKGNLKPGRRCRWCGCGGLHWAETPDGYRLMDSKQSLHTCGEYRTKDET